MRIILSFIICTLLSMNALVMFSQSKYGNATLDELNMTTYEADSTASAVMLLKKGDTKFVYNELFGFQFEYTLHVRIKILNEEGLGWANNEISYYQASRDAKEEIRGLSGTTYNLEGGKVVKTKLGKDNIFEEESDKKWKLKKFTMPAAKVGSVIEYKYTVVSDFYQFLRDFNFQEAIPIDYVSYDINIPEYFRFSLNMKGYEQIAAKREPTNQSFHIRYKDNNGRSQLDNITCTAERTIFTGKQISALKPENYMWTVKDYRSKVSFELHSTHMPGTTIKNFSSSWENIDKEIFDIKSFGGNLKKDKIFKDEIVAGDVTLEKAIEIQNLVKSKVKWNEKNSVFPDNLDKALKDGLGNSADMNFLLINALSAAGFESYPVILSSRSNGLLPHTHPSLAAFNYVLTAVQIDTLMYFADASAKYGDWNILPEDYMVTQARIMKKKGSTWVDLSTLSTGSVNKSYQCEFADSKYIIKTVESRRGNSALEERYNYRSYKDEDGYRAALSKSLHSREISDFSIENLESTHTPLVIKYTQIQDFDLGEDILYINPLPYALFTTNPFKSETRVFPVNFDYLENYVQVVNLTIPEGYEIEELPQSERLVMLDNALSFTYRIGQNGDVIQVQYRFQVNQIQFLQTDYDLLKDFFSKMALKSAEQIVFKKKAEA